jgi:signal recognition particle subunit SRP19
MGDTTTHRDKTGIFIIMGKKKGGPIVRVKQMGGGGGIGSSNNPNALSSQLLNPFEALTIPPEEQYRLPPTPDRKYQIFWPLSQTFSMKIQSFQIIYPSYIDQTKTVQQGRRIGLDHAVPTPTVSDLSSALQRLGVRHVLQPYRGYSRDITCQWDNPGRLLVDVSTFKKKELLRKCAAIIPTLPDRVQRLDREAVEAHRAMIQLEEERLKYLATLSSNTGKRNTAANALTATASASNTGSNKKKIGKKSRKK